MLIRQEGGDRNVYPEKNCNLETFNGANAQMFWGFLLPALIRHISYHFGMANSLQEGNKHSCLEQKPDTKLPAGELSAS